MVLEDSPVPDDLPGMSLFDCSYDFSSRVLLDGSWGSASHFDEVDSGRVTTVCAEDTVALTNAWELRNNIFVQQRERYIHVSLWCCEVFRHVSSVHVVTVSAVPFSIGW